MVIQYSPISTMKALVWSAAVNGVVAVPLLVVIVLLASKKSVMGAYTASRTLIVLGWITTVVMEVAAALMLFPVELDRGAAARTAGLGPATGLIYRSDWKAFDGTVKPNAPGH